MPIIKHNGTRAKAFSIKEDKFFIDDHKVKKGDTLYYRCDRCGHTEEIKFRAHKSFIEKKISGNNITCSTCLRKQTNLEKYGVENLSQSPEIQAKIKANSMEKYGTEHFLASKEIRDKINATNLERYGSENIFQSQEIKDKSKATMMLHHGVEYSLQSNEIKKKMQKSMMDKYGAESAMHSFQIKEKRRTSMQSTIENKIFDFIHITPMFKKKDFIGINKFYKWKCNTCSFTFEDHLDYGHIPRCPRCNPKKVKVNRKKQELTKWLKEDLKIENMVIDDKHMISPFTLSIYLPDHHIGIEVFSLYWDSEFQGKDRNYQIQKSSLCAAKNIQLMSIFEDEWNHKQDIVKSLIKRKLGLLGNTIKAEDCTIREITNRDARFFYQKNHIQGHVNTQHNYGLMHQTEGLVSCLSLSPPRFNHNYTWEVVRFANRLNINVMGALGRFMKFFKNYNKGSIIAYGDCRYFDSNLYEYNGFTHLSRSEPNYFYTDYSTRHNRLQFQKKKLEKKLTHYDPDMTEWQNMQMNGWDRIWDSGSNVYIID